MKAVSKVFVILATLAICVVYAEYEEGHNGRSACKTDEEMNTIYWRNNNDPTAYWICDVQNTPAVARRCGPDTAFMTSTKKCVPWDEWLWETPVDPPNKSYE